ncbi:putative inactive leucine-rich repeat receptor-like protein kinase [Heracleum sosnowskyi]|uniref:Inactive leucine-rich repeat receptor-like protein kinase n=1 Tax=Heracleum sosnowskyi TaxID=360622 RepID=A0AAD8H4E3_9APIA|nr:putative inactive leucine-rich repeat receptor-like protein kinase [Heracleum sosnowskyi]
MGCSNLLLIVYVLWVFCISTTHQLQSSETQDLLQLRKHLEYPVHLQSWENYNGDLCYMPSTLYVSITCHDNFVSELKIMGDKHAGVSEFYGFAVPNMTLSERFSIDSFVTTLTRLKSLRVLNLVSLGIWGPLPDKIHRLRLLEVLDMSSNFMFGSIPHEFSKLVKIRTLTFDSNYFNGTVPDWLDSLSNLTILSIKNNRLKGLLPSSISKVTTLEDMSLSHNKITGKMPDMSALSNLRLLDMRENGLDSDLPLMPGGLTTILLSRNSLSGAIPHQFSKLNKLQHLDLSFNFLTGEPPAALFSLRNISYLNLASNMLGGSLPGNLTCGDELGFVDISNNRLIGRLPSCLSSTSQKRIGMFGGNCLSTNTQHQHPESFCKVTVGKEKSRKRSIAVLIGVIGGIVFVVVLLTIFLLALRRRYSAREEAVVQHTLPKIVQQNAPSGMSLELLANARVISESAKLGTQGSVLYQVFSLEELEEATNDFDESAMLGEGSAGKLYKGRLDNGTFITVRVLPLFRKNSVRNLKLRLDLLSKLRHPHLVALLGHCIDGGGQDDSTTSRVFLVYEFVPNGNFRAHLSENSPEKVLNWSDRLQVLIGIAKAVHFLHTGVYATFGNRLKTNNILLDDHRIAKLSDYGISIITEDIEKLEAKKEGSRSWHHSKSEDDVYNFGFILMEVLVGPILSGKGEAYLLNEMTSFGSLDGRKRIVDPVVLTTCSQESLTTVISITNKCISADPTNRPSFEDVLWNLQYAAQVQATADADQKSSTSSQ